MKTGILALQGNFEAHGRILESLDVPWIVVNTSDHLREIDGLIVPGGESSTMLKLMTPAIRDGLIAFHAAGNPIYGTCAGAILLAREVVNPPQPSLGFLDAMVERNGYGRQQESSIVRRGDPGVEGESVPEEMVFIRAPLIHSPGKAVRILASVDNNPVFVEQGNIIVTTFHPELSSDSLVHLRFLEKIKSHHV
jgi:pyridoxal 5'-phosphate synthase pdxT subunit